MPLSIKCLDRVFQLFPRQCLYFGVAMAALHGQRSLADLSADQPAHHFYNAELLEPSEVQVSIIGNVKVGLVENVELGSNGLFLLSGLPNLSLKHRMFEGDQFRTAFSSHLFMLSGASGSESDESTSNSSSVNDTNTAFFGAAGVVTSTDIGAGRSINWGLYDFLIFGQVPLIDIDVSAHILTPTLGLDVLLAKNFGMSLALAYPAYMHGSLNSEFIEAELSFVAAGGDFGKIFTQGFATFTVSAGSFNLEFGAARLLAVTTPYFNIFWRFDG
jgi:hypothetical protein